jgi:hypothetical protein
MKGKVFGIGLPRTGTRSLSAALDQLGIRTAHYPMDAATAREVVEGRPYSILDRVDGLTDLHAVVRFRGLDFRYPGSKFILTVRDKGRWLDSYLGHFAKTRIQDDPQPIRAMTETLRQQAWGSVGLDRDRLSLAYDEHHRLVAKYFERRGGLLRLDIIGGDGWGKLCPFLGKKNPGGPFPNISG